MMPFDALIARRWIGGALLLAVACTGTSGQKGPANGATGTGAQPGSTSGGAGLDAKVPGRDATSDVAGARAMQPGTGGAGAAAAGSAGRGTSGLGAAGMDAAVASDGALLDAGPDSGAPSGTPYLYVSGYGSDISVFSLDPSTFAATKRSSQNAGSSPSYLAIAPSKRFLYAINEADAPNSKVVAFSIASSDGHLSQINSAQTGGSGSPHLAVHPSGKWIAVAHYTSGHTSILPVLDNGGVGDATDVQMGPNNGCGKAHQAVFDSTGNYLFVPCLQSNYVIQFKLADGKLSYNTPPTIAVTGGPRHMAFDPSEHYAYVLSETDSIITSFKYDAQTGTLSDPQTINSYDQQKGASAHIVVHPSGSWLYASNRTENSIGLFSIDANGRPHAVAFQKDMIATPRDFSLDPSGTFLISANQDGAQNVLVFRVDPADGKLTRAQVVPVGGSPTFTKVLLLP
jgi:6-phosphogluconolactonase